MAVINPPQLPPLIFNGYGKYVYVFTYKNIWDKEAKVAKRTNSVKIGKIVGGKESKDGLIQFNDDFIKHYPELSKLNVFRNFDSKDKKNKLIFKPKEEVEELYSIEKLRSTIKLHAGATWALDMIMADTPLLKALKKVFPKYHRYLKILSLAYFIVLNTTNVMSDYEAFSETTLLPWKGIMNASTISKLFKSITQEEIDNFHRALYEFYFEEQNKDGTKHTFLALDSTSISTYSKELAYADYGHNKDGDELPQINVIFLVDQATGDPLFFRLFDGPVPDVNTVRRTIADMTRLDLSNNNIIIVADKGYPSVKNIDDCLRTNTSFLFNLKVNKNNIASDVINAHISEFSDANNYDSYLESNIYSESSDWKYDAFPIDGIRQSKKDFQKLWYHVYYNKKIYLNSVDALIHNVASAKEKFNRNETLGEYEQNYIDKYCSVDNDSHIATIDNKKIENRTKYSGFRVLVSDCVDNAKLAAFAYREREEVEYGFHTMKSRLNCNRFRTSSNETLAGKALVQFIASSISIRVRKRLASAECFKDSEIKLNSADSKYVLVAKSDHKVLQLLNNIMAIKDKNGYIFDEVSDKKASLYKKLGIKGIPTSTKDIYEIDNDDDLLAVNSSLGDDELTLNREIII